MALGAEDIELIRVFDYIRSRPDIEPHAFHCANERRTSPQAGQILKRKGVKPGVPDIIILKPCGRYHGLLIELKVGKGKLSPAQKDFLATATTQGYMAVCCYGFEAARAIIEAYFG